MNDFCQMCRSLGQKYCPHDPSVHSAQCWQGMHSGDCRNWCQCSCHTGTFPPDTPKVSQTEVDDAIASIQMSIRT